MESFLSKIKGFRPSALLKEDFTQEISSELREKFRKGLLQNSCVWLLLTIINKTINLC